MTKQAKKQRKPKPKGKPVKKAKPASTTREWHRLDFQFIEGGGIQPAVIDGVPIFIPGKLATLPVIQVPMSASPDQILAIAKTAKGIVGREPLVVTTNVKLLKLVPVTEEWVHAFLESQKLKTPPTPKVPDAGSEQAVESPGDGPLPNGERVDAHDDPNGRPALGAEDRGEAPAQPGEGAPEPVIEP